jgi:hypothetical protein
VEVLATLPSSKSLVGCLQMRCFTVARGMNDKVEIIHIRKSIEIAWEQRDPGLIAIAQLLQEPSRWLRREWPTPETPGLFLDGASLGGQFRPFCDPQATIPKGLTVLVPSSHDQGP